MFKPGAVATELESHNNDQVEAEVFEPFNAENRKLEAEEIAHGIAFMVTRPRHASIAELLILPTTQQ